MRDYTCNGWTNYETWNVALYIDQDAQEYWLDVALDVYHHAYDNADASSPLSVGQQAACDLADQLKADHEENAPELNGTYADLLNAALSRVNWYEIAKNILDRRES